MRKLSPNINIRETWRRGNSAAPSGFVFIFLLLVCFCQWTIKLIQTLSTDPQPSPCTHFHPVVDVVVGGRTYRCMAVSLIDVGDCWRWRSLSSVWRWQCFLPSHSSSDRIVAQLTHPTPPHTHSRPSPAVFLGERLHSSCFLDRCWRYRRWSCRCWPCRCLLR